MGSQTPEWALRLREAKYRKHLTHEKLAARAGVSEGTVLRVLQGDDRVSLCRIAWVAEAAGLSLEDMFGKTET